MMKRITGSHAARMVLAAAVLGSAPAFAANIYQWNGTTDTGWQTASNWAATPGQPAWGGTTTSADRINVNGGGNELNYTSAEGATTFATLQIGGTTANSQMTVSGGTFTAPSISIGNSGSGTCSLIVDGGNLVGSTSALIALNNTATANSVLTIKSGTTTAYGVSLKCGNTTGSTMNLDGGTFAVGGGGVALAIAGSTTTPQPRVFNFNGGTLKTTYSLANFAADTANVRDGGAIIDSNGFNPTIAQALVHSTIAGDRATDGGLTKQGAGKLILSGTNTYTGATTVTGGTLALGNALAASISSSSILNVASGATFTDGYSTGRNLTFAGLKGGGTLNAGTTSSKFITAGTLAPVDSATGMLTIAKGSLEVGSGATYNFEVGGTTDAPTVDLISLTGSGSTVSFAGSWTLNLANLGNVNPTGKTFVLFQSASPITSAGSWSIGTRPANWTGGTITVSGNQVLLSNVTVPEPGTVGMALGAMALGLLCRRSCREAAKVA